MAHMRDMNSKQVKRLHARDRLYFCCRKKTKKNIGYTKKHGSKFVRAKIKKCILFGTALVSLKSALLVCLTPQCFRKRLIEEAGANTSFRRCHSDRMQNRNLQQTKELWKRIPSDFNACLTCDARILGLRQTEQQATKVIIL